jgi:RHS repeat-associated protein
MHNVLHARVPKVLHAIVTKKSRANAKCDDLTPIFLCRFFCGAGITSASYGYGPFGEAIRASGTSAAWNAIRFSSKYRDAEMDMAYYGHRYYASLSGRWLNRDPINEPGFYITHAPMGGAYGYETLLYQHVSNDPISKVDRLGLSNLNAPPSSTSICLDPCGDAKRRGMDKGANAGVICCEGKPYICIWKNPPGATLGGRPGFETAKQIIINCVNAHEADHVRQEPCKCTGFYRSTTHHADQDECESYYVEMGCLRSGLKQCNGDPWCEQAIKDELAGVAAAIVKRCGAANGK